MHPWFIFTTTGLCARLEADSVTKAVSGFRKLRHPNAGDVVGVIRGSAAMQMGAHVVPTSVFGVICCIDPEKGEQRG